MLFHEYRKIWEHKSNEILEVKMEPTNKMDKFIVAVIKNKKKDWTPSSWKNWGAFENNFLLLEM